MDRDGGPPPHRLMPPSLHRFFVDPDLIGEQQVALAGEQAHQISRVLRLKPGDRVVLVDGLGHEATVRLDEVRSSAVTGAIEAVQAGRPEPSLYLTLYQALVPRERFETVLQKGTEVGIARFVPTWCERSIVPGGDKIDERRLERWRRIVTEAAEQCERGVVPSIEAPLRFPDVITAAISSGPTILAWEREQRRSVRDGLRTSLTPLPPLPQAGEGETVEGRYLSIFIGPEGGFTDSEIDLACQAGAILVSLGPRILRTETAGPVLAALALYEAGDLDP